MLINFKTTTEKKTKKKPQTDATTLDKSFNKNFYILTVPINSRVTNKF